ncbi:hypothetical protein BaRGS_00032967 [Batillaria attramentaria]|uniref:Uncharacterized protein n=1 Tax=Batillaria attramentaria TaxID=370345 RepID=A0ABD0JLQ2_9CAEN
MYSICAEVDVAGSCAGGDSTKCKTGTVCDAADSVCKKKVEESCTKDDDCAGSNVACTGLICTCTAGSANSDKTDCSGVAGLAGSIFLLIAALVTSRFL